MHNLFSSIKSKFFSINWDSNNNIPVLKCSRVKLFVDNNEGCLSYQRKTKKFALLIKINFKYKNDVFDIYFVEYEIFRNEDLLVYTYLYSRGVCLETPPRIVLLSSTRWHSSLQVAKPFHSPIASFSRWDTIVKYQILLYFLQITSELSQKRVTPDWWLPCRCIKS